MGGKLDQARTYIKHNSRVLLGVIGGIALASVAVGLWAIFSYIEPISAGERKDTLTLLAQIVAGLVLLLGVYLTYRRVTSAENAVEVAQEGQITERFTRAIEQLGDEKLAVRLGGIYALERIARDSERDHWPIMEVLTAFVRENARWKVPRELSDFESGVAGLC
jgi:ABC-type nickel/cobalt efflux system permease component RcnA